MSQEENIQQAVKMIEEHVEKMYRLTFEGVTRPPVIDLYKASAMAEFARRLRAKAIKIEEDWLHLVRE